MLVMHLMRFKWDERNPYPSYETLAERTGTSYNAIRAQVKSLADKGYLNKIRSRQRIEYDLSPLFAALTRHIKGESEVD